MKLAEALSLRKDLLARVEQLRNRISNNVKVQEGDSPLENPDTLTKELHATLDQLETLIARINATNITTRAADGQTMTQLLAARDVLSMRINALRAIYNNASENRNRYSNSEIKFVTVIDVNALAKQIDALAKQYRELDMRIQALNFATELAD